MELASEEAIGEHVTMMENKAKLVVSKTGVVP